MIPVIPLNLLGCETGWHGGLLPKIPGSPRFRAGSDLRSLSGILTTKVGKELRLETSRPQKLDNEFPWTHPTFAYCRFYNPFQPEACRIRLLIHLVGLPTMSLSFVRSFNAKHPVHTDTFKECKVVSHRAQFASRILYSMLDPNRSGTPTNSQWQGVPVSPSNHKHHTIPQQGRNCRNSSSMEMKCFYDEARARPRNHCWHLCNSWAIDWFGQDLQWSINLKNRKTGNLLYQQTRNAMSRRIKDHFKNPKSRTGKVSRPSFSDLGLARWNLYRITCLQYTYSLYTMHVKNAQSIYSAMYV